MKQSNGQNFHFWLQSTYRSYTSQECPVNGLDCLEQVSAKKTAKNTDFDIGALTVFLKKFKMAVYVDTSLLIALFF